MHAESGKWIGNSDGSNQKDGKMNNFQNGAYEMRVQQEEVVFNWGTPESGESRMPAAGGHDMLSGRGRSRGGRGQGRGRGRGQQERGGKSCFKCGEVGHMSKDCQGGSGTASRRGGSAGSGCFKCQEEGHLARDCPNEASKSNDASGKPRPPLYTPTYLEEDKLFDEGVSVGVNFEASYNIPVKVTGEGNVPQPVSSFDELNIRKLLIENVTKAEYRNPTPIQKYAIPVIMEGRDVMACAQTGSGKTAAYLLPILHYVLANNCDSNAYETPAKPNAVIIAPTRELSVQIYNESRKFSFKSIVKSVVIYGGTSVDFQHKSLMAGCHVLVGTPGRLTDFLDKGLLNFEAVKFLVLDEADRMLDLGFLPAVQKLIEHPTMPSVGNRQTLLFSATFPVEIQRLAQKYLHKYLFVVVGSIGCANCDVKQSIISVSRTEKRETLIKMLKEDLAKTGDEKVLVFVETKRTADFLAAYLSQQGLSTTSIHGDRYQHQREEALFEFKRGVRRVLVATAVAARGLDIKGVSHVVNYDLPKEIDEYVHRIGRTGRVGNRGNAVSFYDEISDAHLALSLVKILSDAEQEVPNWLMNASHQNLDAPSAGESVFSCSDFRSAKTSGLASFGGPTPVASALGGGGTEEEEDWG